MQQYLTLCNHILMTGQTRLDRTGTGTIGVFGYQMRFNLSEGFPLVTTKDMDGSRLNAIIEELLWFLDGDTNVKTLMDKGVNIWNPDGYRHFKQKNVAGSELASNMKEYKRLVQALPHFGDLGRIYGAQWRSWMTPDMEVPEGEEYPRRKTIDQISQVIDSIKNDPFGRRHIVSAWNPGELDKMALPPCHVLFQFYVTNDRRLSCQLYQRSGDVFLGVPFNIASYALLTMMIADQCGLGYGEFIHTLGDAHIYLNHVQQVQEQVKREPYPMPLMLINPHVKSIFDYQRADFALIDYLSHEAIKGDVSVG